MRSVAFLDSWHTLCTRQTHLTVCSVHKARRAIAATSCLDVLQGGLHRRHSAIRIRISMRVRRTMSRQPCQPWVSIWWMNHPMQVIIRDPTTPCIAQIWMPLPSRNVMKNDAVQNMPTRRHPEKVSANSIFVGLIDPGEVVDIVFTFEKCCYDLLVGDFPLSCVWLYPAGSIQRSRVFADWAMVRKDRCWLAQYMLLARCSRGTGTPSVRL